MIEWKMVDHAIGPPSLKGMLRGITILSIDWSVVSPSERGMPYVLKIDLPAMRTPWRFASEEDAKTMAASYIDTWLKRVGLMETKSIQDALGTEETGEALVEVARNAHKAEQELAGCSGDPANCDRPESECPCLYHAEDIR